MRKNEMMIIGMILDYSLDSKILSIYASFKIEGFEKLIIYKVPAFGTEYDAACNQLFLYRKDGTVNLDFLPETFVIANIVEEAGQYCVKDMKLDCLSYI